MAVLNIIVLVHSYVVDLQGSVFALPCFEPPVSVLPKVSHGMRRRPVPRPRERLVDEVVREEGATDSHVDDQEELN